MTTTPRADLGYLSRRLQPGYNYVGQTDARKPYITQREERLRERKENVLYQNLQGSASKRRKTKKTFFLFLSMHRKALLSFLLSVHCPLVEVPLETDPKINFVLGHFSFFLLVLFFLTERRKAKRRKENVKIH
jgi:hypothetical protein